MAACATALPGATADAQDPAQAAYGVEIYEQRIPMPDGVRLAADLCLPERRGEHGRFPGLLEYLPDRTDEGRGGRFSDFSYFVRNG